MTCRTRTGKARNHLIEDVMGDVHVGFVRIALVLNECDRESFECVRDRRIYDNGCNTFIHSLGAMPNLMIMIYFIFVAHFFYPGFRYIALGLEP